MSTFYSTYQKAST